MSKAVFLLLLCRVHRVGGDMKGLGFTVSVMLELDRLFSTS